LLTEHTIKISQIFSDKNNPMHRNPSKFDPSNSPPVLEAKAEPQGDVGRHCEGKLRVPELRI
jgi:hypothetical protein